MRIFSFPHVVIYELMKQFEPVGLITLSLCSKNTYAFVRNCSKIEEDLKIRGHCHGCDVCLSETVLISVISKTDGYVDTSDFKACISFQYNFGTYRLCSYWKDVAQGCRESTNYICDLFKIPVATVSVESGKYLWLLDFAQRRQEHRLKKVLEYISSDISAESYSTILSCNATETLKCIATPPQDYRFNGKLPPVKYLTIKNGFWITLENLLGQDSKLLEIRYSTLKSPDVNVLLRCWLNGGLPRLRYLDLGIHVDDTIFDGLHNLVETVQVVLYRKVRNSEMGLVFDSNAYHIRREENVVATVSVGMRSFWMVVWPDLNGKCV